jgi:hypothetical protein
LLWIYLFTNCSKIGLWEENREEVEYRLRKKLDWEKTREIFSEKVAFIGNNWIIKKFIELQYPKLLEKPTSPLHVAVFSELKKKCLNLNGNSLCIDYTYPMHSLQVKEEVKEEEKDKEKEEVKEKEKTWRTDFETYLSMVISGRDDLFNNQTEMAKQAELNPGIDIFKTVEKAIHNFWGKKSGWEHKKKSHSKEIDMVSTLINSISMQSNRVWLPKNTVKFGRQDIAMSELLDQARRVTLE